MLIDNLLPTYDFNEIHAVEVDASADVVYAALLSVDFGRPLVVRALMGVRSIPSLLRSRRRSGSGQSLTLREISRAGFTPLGEDPPREIVLGIQGTFWQLRPQLDAIDAASFATPVPPGVARAVWNFSVAPLADARSRLTTETRILCGDARSKRTFGFYWAVIQPGSAVIRLALLREVSKQARRQPQS